MIDLETRILNRLQEKKRGQTLERLQKYLNVRLESDMLVALHNLRRHGSVTCEKSVWSLVLAP